MGYSLSLLAINSINPDAVLTDLGITRTGQFCEYATMPLSGFALPSDWYLVVATRCNHRFLRQKELQRISRMCQVIACSIEEHVMFSSAEQWIDGAMLWRAEHVGENGLINLKTNGVLPSTFQEIFESQAAKQEQDGGENAKVDHYFDIPLNVVKSIIGFKHDEEVSFVKYDQFDLLSQAESNNKKPWWRIWRN